MLACFYGYPEVKKRIEGYNVLRCLNQLQPNMWLCVGDFNELLYQFEKSGGPNRSTKQMQLFHDALQECNLNSSGFLVGFFIWCNNMQDNTFTKEKFYRAVASNAWCEIYGDGEIKILATSSSDHYPLLLSIQ